MKIKAMQVETELAALRDKKLLKMQEIKLQIEEQKALVMGQLLAPA